RADRRQLRRRLPPQARRHDLPARIRKIDAQGPCLFSRSWEERKSQAYPQKPLLPSWEKVAAKRSDEGAPRLQAPPRLAAAPRRTRESRKLPQPVPSTTPTRTTHAHLNSEHTGSRVSARDDQERQAVAPRRPPSTPGHPGLDPGSSNR